MIELKRILLASDFSENSRRATEFACGLAEKFGAELHLLHVCPHAAAMLPEVSGNEDAAGNYEHAAEQAALQQLEGLLDPAWSAGRSIVRATRTGLPVAEIVRYARESAVDLIVLGTHGRTGLAHLLMGSVAENVVRHAACPVLTIRSFPLQ
jgi:nucleotide-binding universal stress UspA family protein